jgi:hypothetical protein
MHPFYSPTSNMVRPPYPPSAPLPAQCLWSSAPLPSPLPKILVKSPRKVPPDPPSLSGRRKVLSITDLLVRVQAKGTVCADGGTGTLPRSLWRPLKRVQGSQPLPASASPRQGYSYSPALSWCTICLVTLCPSLSPPPLNLPPLSLTRPPASLTPTVRQRRQGRKGKLREQGALV